MNIRDAMAILDQVFPGGDVLIQEERSLLLYLWGKTRLIEVIPDEESPGRIVAQASKLEGAFDKALTDPFPIREAQDFVGWASFVRTQLTKVALGAIADVLTLDNLWCDRLASDTAIGGLNFLLMDCLETPKEAFHTLPSHIPIHWKNSKRKPNERWGARIVSPLFSSSPLQFREIGRAAIVLKENQDPSGNMFWKGRLVVPDYDLDFNFRSPNENSAKKMAEFTLMELARKELVRYSEE